MLRTHLAISDSLLRGVLLLVMCLLFTAGRATALSGGDEQSEPQTTASHSETDGVGSLSWIKEIEYPGDNKGIRELPNGMYVIACKGKKGVCFTVTVPDDTGGRLLMPADAGRGIEIDHMASRQTGELTWYTITPAQVSPH